MTLDEMLAKQMEFDREHSSSYAWNEKITNNNIQILEHLLLSLLGELGESANIVKKVIRGDVVLEDVKSALSDEIIDVLIYVLKLIYQLDINIEEVYARKLAINKQRFAKYNRNTSDN